MLKNPLSTRSSFAKPKMSASLRMQQNKQLRTKINSNKLSVQGGGSSALGWAQFGLNIISTIANIWMAMKQLDLAERQFAESKKEFQKNFQMAVLSVKDKMAMRKREQLLSKYDGNLKMEKAIEEAYANGDLTNSFSIKADGKAGNDNAEIGYDTKNQDSKIASYMSDLDNLAKTGRMPPKLANFATKTRNPNVDYSKAAINVSQAKDVNELNAHIDSTTTAAIVAKTPEEAQNIEQKTFATKYGNPEPEQKDQNQNQDFLNQGNSQQSAFAIAKKWNNNLNNGYQDKSWQSKFNPVFSSYLNNSSNDFLSAFDTSANVIPTQNGQPTNAQTGLQQNKQSSFANNTIKHSAEIQQFNKQMQNEGTSDGLSGIVSSFNSTKTKPAPSQSGSANEDTAKEQTNENANKANANIVAQKETKRKEKNKKALSAFSGV